MLELFRSKARVTRRGPAHIDGDTLRVNFSLVLHERSDSAAVAEHVNAAVGHAARIESGRFDGRATTPAIGFDELATMRPEVILTATVGLPRLTQRLARRCPGAPLLIVADRLNGGFSEVEFFRATAALALPEIPVSRLTVAAAMLRPGARSVELVAHGPFAWPSERLAALRALEDLIRDYLPQWHPPRRLWPGPAEDVLPEFQVSMPPDR